jgi:hypothetical protein
MIHSASQMLAVPLTSQLSDDAFLELKTISLTSPTGAVVRASGMDIAADLRVLTCA